MCRRTIMLLYRAPNDQLAGQKGPQRVRVPGMSRQTEEAPGSYKHPDRVGSSLLQGELFPTSFEVLSLHMVFQLLDTSIHLSKCCLMLEDVVFPNCTRSLVLLLSYIFWFHCCIFSLVASSPPVCKA